GDLTTHPRDLGGVLELAGGVAEAQVERLLLRLAQLLHQVGEGQLAQVVGGAGHQIASSRVMTRALIGSFWIAFSSAVRAWASSGNESSKRPRPGLTTAPTPLGLPLPRP